MPFAQGVAMELLRGAPPAGAHLDVGGAGHHGPALHALPGALRRLRLAPGLRHHHGALRHAAGGECHRSPLYFLLTAHTFI